MVTATKVKYVCPDCGHDIGEMVETFEQYQTMKRFAIDRKVHDESLRTKYHKEALYLVHHECCQESYNRYCEAM